MGQTMLDRVCRNCGKNFKATLSDVNKGGGKFCCRKCYIENKKLGVPEEYKNGVPTKCLYCGKDMLIPFNRYKSGRNKYCSKECRERSFRRVNRICEHCGKEFLANTCDVERGDGKFCSVDCANSARSKFFQDKRVERTCEMCGKKFKVRPSQNGIIKTKKDGRLYNTGRFCSKECRQLNLSVYLRGENCHLWKGGVSFEPYCEKFNISFRERVRARFGYVCVVCGKTQEENGRKLSVHHVDYRKDSCCSEDAPRRFVSLCKNCHSITNNNRDWWVNYFNDLINKKYEGKTYLTIEEHAEYKKSSN